ncbi:MAG: RdgB/HAM1 family non-canonical purine NTP pyrophosphatase, partial [Oscillospiraceae bacterium]|nr:RdgB/HAM1 family non-canonical purine NTP pyrophosphatase [Oscillospiraceae bacterium]
MRYLLATGNKHKLREFAAMLGNVDCSECEVEEDGGTFEANALIKVRAIASRADGAYCIADDSGLCVDALDGAPGIYSARYGRGESGPARVLRELDGIANRKAQMVTAIACIMPDGREFTVRGECEGEITAEPRGYDGFGYDPIFIPRGYSRTNAELTESEKNAISGRSVAIRMLRREVARLTARNVLIMGGTFNPPHDGHEYLLRTAIAEYDLAIVIPTGVPPHKRLPDGSPSNLERLEMTRLAFPDCEVSDIEIFRNEPSYTADTIRELGEKYPSAEFTLLMGNDMYDSLPQWYDYAWLREHVKFRMVGRDAVPTTSTRLRELLPQRQGRELLTSEVYVYVVKHRLYGVKPEFAWLWATAMKWYDESRLPHILATESLAVRLAERWGADVEETRTAALLHDITKKFDRKTHLTTLRDYGIIAETPESDNI